MATRFVRRLALAALLALPAAADGPSPAALIEAGHWKRALPLVEARLRSSPDDAEANYLLARYKLEVGDLDAALSLAEKATNLDNKNADYRYLLGEVYGRKAEKANVFSQFGLARRFKREAEAAIALDPKHIDAREALIEYHLQAPGIVGGDKAKARVLADEIMKIDASRGYLALAVIARHENHTDQLEGLLKKAVEADPKSYEALLTLADFYASDAQKKHDLAEKFARDAAKLEPDRASAYSVLALVFATEKRLADLDAILAEAEKNVRDSLVPHYQAGRVLFVTGNDLPRAEGYFRKYLTQEPELKAPTLAHAHWRLGLVLEKQGRKPEAIQELETALRIKPDLEEAKKDLKRLK